MANPKEHPHTRAVRLVKDDVAKVVASLQQGPGFMEEVVSPRTKARRERLTNAPDSVKALFTQGYTREFVDRLAKLMES